MLHIKDILNNKNEYCFKNGMKKIFHEVISSNINENRNKII